MKVLSKLDSLDNINDGETRKLVTKATSNGSGNVVSSVSVSGDTVTYTKGVTALTAHQNAFSNVKVGSTTVAADSAGDTLELVAGSNVTLTPDATNDKVTIAASQPTVNNGTLTIQKNGTNVQTFSANQSGNATANITVPTKTSDLTNDSNYITNTGSTSGNAGTATTLQSFYFNRNADTNIWFKVATTTITKKASSWEERHAFLFIKGCHNSNYNQNGIIAIDAMGNGQSGKVGSYNAQFMSATKDLDLENFYIEYLNGDADNDGIVNFWIRANTNGYASWQAKILQNTGWTIAGAAPTATALPSTGYTGKNAVLSGSVAKAIGDKNGDDITTTYYKASNPNGYTSNTGTITKVQANGTDVASSGTANIPAATTSKYGVTELSSATNSTSEALAATPKAVKAAYDLAASKGTGTITGVSVNGTSVATSGVANITSMPASILSGAIPSAVTATTQSASDNSTKLATTAFVKTAIDNLPEPMVFKGTLGTGGTITALPTNGTASIGDTYKVITAGTYASKAAKVGDTFICLTKTSSANTWELIPSGDEPSGTVTSVKIEATSPIAVNDSSAITTSGTRTISHANSGVTAGTYKSVTVNATGHVTAGSNPTTLSGYGITDAKIASGVITLGSNTITPLTSHQDISGKLDKSGGAMTGAITRSLAGSGTIANTNLFTVTGSTDGFKVDYASTTADVGITTLSTTDDANAKISIGNTVSSTYKEAIGITNGSAVVNGYTVAAASAKAVVTSIDTSASLPTSNAVKTFVEGKGYVLKSGDTMTGALNFANNTVNKVGDDVSFGDFNKAGMLGIIGQNGTTGIALIKNGSSWSASAERAEMVYNSTDKCIEFNFA